MLSINKEPLSGTLNSKIINRRAKNEKWDKSSKFKLEWSEFK